MTDEGQEHGPDDTPAPPASTRWSEDAAEDSDAIAPPFVPGRAASDRTPVTTGERSPGAEPEIEPGPDAEEDASSPVGGPAEDDFPFEEFDIDGAGGETAVEPPESSDEGVGAPYADEPEVAGTAWSPADLGHAEPREEAPGPEAGSEVEAESEPEPEVEAESEPLWEAEPEPEPEVEPELAGAAGAGWVPGPGPTSSAAVTGAAEEAAELLDRLSGMLRSEGEAAVRREMDSDDRLMAILAGVLAGYVSGRS